MRIAISFFHVAEYLIVSAIFFDDVNECLMGRSPTFGIGLPSAISPVAPASAFIGLHA